MTPVPITERETVEYALNQPDMLRVHIKPPETLIDRRDVFNNNVYAADYRNTRGCTP